MSVFLQSQVAMWLSTDIAERVSDFVTKNAGFEYQDIANILGITVAQVKWALENPPTGIVYKQY